MSAARVAGLVLAGGRGSRLGASVPKPLVEVGGRPLVAHVLDRMPAAVSPILVGANDVEAFAQFELPVVPDRLGGFRGPLAALDAASAWLRERCSDATHLLCLPGDTPFLPADVAGRLIEAADDRPCVARSGGRPHPAVALWPLRVLAALPDHLADGGDQSVMRFAMRHGFASVEFDAMPGAPDGDPFFNVNAPADLARARAAFGGG